VAALKKRGAFLLIASMTLSSSLFYATSTLSQESSHAKIIMRGFDGTPLVLESKTPYSPKKTCGSCHNYNQITNGYHFQQGRTDGTGKVVMGDTFDSKYPWSLSSGM
jgi:hypothetical protein